MNTSKLYVNRIRRTHEVQNKLPGFLMALYEIEYLGGSHYQNDLSHRIDQEKVKETVEVSSVEEALATIEAMKQKWAHDPYLDYKITEEPMQDKFLLWVNNKWVDVNAPT